MFTGQSTAWIVKGLFNKPQQEFQQESLFINCKDVTDRKG